MNNRRKLGVIIAVIVVAASLLISTVVFVAIPFITEAPTAEEPTPTPTPTPTPPKPKPAPPTTTPEPESEPITQEPELTVEKWVKISGDCSWQKEISAQIGAVLEFKIEVVATGIFHDVVVADPGIDGEPWIRVDQLRVDDVPYEGNIIEGISLGTLQDETRVITFTVWLCSQTSQYHCGDNELVNLVKVSWNCGEAEASVKIKIDVICPPDSDPSPPPRPSPPDPCPEPTPPPFPPDPDPCPDPIPPPPPPDEDKEGPAPRPA